MPNTKPTNRFNKHAGATPPPTYAPTLSKTANIRKQEATFLKRTLQALFVLFALALVEIFAPNGWKPITDLAQSALQLAQAPHSNTPHTPRPLFAEKEPEAAPSSAQAPSLSDKAWAWLKQTDAILSQKADSLFASFKEPTSRSLRSQAVIATQTPVYEAPSHFSTSVAIVSAGTEVTLKSARGEWREIYVQPFERPLWVPADHLLEAPRTEE